MLTVMISAVGLADIAKPGSSPKPEASVNTTLRINLKADAKEARLVIPKNQIDKLRAQLDSLDNGGNTAAAVSINTSRIPTIVGGLFLSLAIVFGGIWFASRRRSSSTSSTAVIVIATLAGIGSTASFVYGNMGPPPEARSITGKMFATPIHMYNTGYGAVKLEISDDSDYSDIVLIVPDPKETPKTDE
jgi:hypothetical protein